MGRPMFLYELSKEGRRTRDYRAGKEARRPHEQILALLELPQTWSLWRPRRCSSSKQQQQQQQQQRQARLQKLQKQLAEKNQDGDHGFVLRQTVQRAIPRGPCGVCYEETPHARLAPC